MPLQSRSDVDCIAERNVMRIRCSDHSSGYSTGIDTDSNLNTGNAPCRFDLCRVSSYYFQNLESSKSRTNGIIFTCPGNPEERRDSVAHVRPNDTTVAFDRLCHSAHALAN
jgi:hypothetical protein